MDAKEPRNTWKLKDLKGQRFGRLEAVERVGFTKHRTSLWKCRCDCGAEVIATVNHLTQGSTKSCGCLNFDTRASQCVKRNVTHGNASRKNPHPLYGTWCNMKERVNNPNRPDYKHYGGRGIRMHPAWEESFEEFLIGVGPRPEGMTLDRIDVNGHYEPGNVRWATWEEQQSNRRNNVRYNVKGETLTLLDMERICGVRRHTIYQRITKLGLTPEQAMQPGKFKRSHENQAI